MPSDLFVLALIVVPAVAVCGAAVIGAVILLAEVARFLDDRDGGEDGD